MAAALLYLSASAARAGPTPSTPPPSRPARTAGRPSSSAPPTPSNFITVDKPPASLWVMELSARIFGVNSWSILVPQALEGVACVGVLYATVRRWFGPVAGLLAGAVLALTPVATLMFRYNNPDALLVLLLTLAAYAMIRAIENGPARAGSSSPRPWSGSGSPPRCCRPSWWCRPWRPSMWPRPASLWRRVRQLVVAGVALLVSAAGGWRSCSSRRPPAAPTSAVRRPTASLNLIFGYNGLGRITGNETGSVGRRRRPGRGWGPTGIGGCSRRHGRSDRLAACPPP